MWVRRKTSIPRKNSPWGSGLRFRRGGDVYREKNLVAQGPTFKKASFEGEKAVVSFEHTGGGLLASPTDSLGGSVENGKVVGFALAGADGVFYPATAVIEGGDKVVVTCAQVTAPKAVRYAFINFPVTNLWNKEGLPAGPFRSDMPK